MLSGNFDQHNDLRYLSVGGRGFCLNSKPEKYLKIPQNPRHQVHALLGDGNLSKST
jgi:hypothetical protein